MPLGIVSNEDFQKELDALNVPEYDKATVVKAEIPIILDEDSLVSGGISNTDAENPPQALVGELLPRLSESNEKRQESVLFQTIERGRGLGNVEVPDCLRRVLASEVIENGRGNAIALAKDFGVSPSSVSAYTKGATSTASYDSPTESIQKTLKDTRNRISSKAKSKLVLAMNHITADKLDGAKLRDIAATAQAMSAVVRNMESSSQSEQEQRANVNFVFFSPNLRDESKYEAIEVSE